MGKVKIRQDFQQARWNEPIIYEMSTPGVRGILIPAAEEEIKSKAGTSGNYYRLICVGKHLPTCRNYPRNMC